jgi:hypothetical protein
MTEPGEAQSLPPAAELAAAAVTGDMAESDVGWVLAAIHGDDGTFDDTGDGAFWL